MNASHKGLLFYVSGSQFEADYARGDFSPTFCKDVNVVDDDIMQSALVCEDTQTLAWKAPGNIYAQRGTLSFFWRSRYPVGPTEFPIFRVGYADHTSWDACWLRIDYNGAGFDAFVTNINLSRTRVCVKLPSFPPEDKWTHIALSWDEELGLKFYINGVLCAQKLEPSLYFAGLDQFGPHSRAISNWNVSSDYNFIRGGDLCRLAIYDQMLQPEAISTLAKGQLYSCKADYQVDMSNQATYKNWLHRNGFGDNVISISQNTSVRKVEIHDAYDVKRWYWKACDGIRETTWPGVFNRSRLEGRNDYFQLPDWDCYTTSGKKISFVTPDEPYNYIEISGSAFGNVTLAKDSNSTSEALFSREPNKERTTHLFPVQTGGIIEFENTLQEQPIGDFSLFYVTNSAAPQSSCAATYSLKKGYFAEDMPGQELCEFICGRHTSYERHIMTACCENSTDKLDDCQSDNNGYPFFNIIIPYQADDSKGLDGIEFTFDTGFITQTTQCSIQIKDPLWYYRNLAHFTCSFDPSKPYKLWIDTRDRILPENRCIYITIAFDNPGINYDLLESCVTLKTIFKPFKNAIAEHKIDRFTQVRDITGHMMEERPAQKEFNMWNRFCADIDDLMKVDPEHIPGQYYYYEKVYLQRTKGKIDISYRPNFKTAVVPKGVASWAFKQIQYLKLYKHLINWYIDNRQIENGEFGGGLSDDGDFTSAWVGLVLMGCNPEKILRSLELCTNAFYEQGMFTNGLCSIQTDELHSSEEGIISLNQCLNANFSSPIHLERAMENARSAFWITGINSAGHRHFKSTYFSGSKMATEKPWGAQQSLSGIALTPSWYLLRFNGNEKLKKLLVELADGLVSHLNKDTGIINGYVSFEQDLEFSAHNLRSRGEMYTLYPAFKATGEQKYYSLILDKFRRISNSYVGEMNQHNPAAIKFVDKNLVEQEYEALCYEAGIRQYYNTHGSPWIDRVLFDYHQIQYDRLAGIAYERQINVYPRNCVRWKFANENDDEKIAILSPVACDDYFKMIICNISSEDVAAGIIGCEILPGSWQVSFGVDTDFDDQIDEMLVSKSVEFERSVGLDLIIPSSKTCILVMKLVNVTNPYSERCDLGICAQDVRFYMHGINVRVHSLGNKDSTEATIVLKDTSGKVCKTALLPPLEAPLDLWPRYRDVIFNTYDILDLAGYTVEIDPYHKLNEITRENNIVIIKEGFSVIGKH